MTDLDRWLANAAVRYIAARRATIDAKQARAAYWQKHNPAPNQSEPGPHSFGTCRMRDTYEGPVEDKTKPLCPVCAGSEPLHQDYLAAAKERGLALRALQRAVAATTRPTTTETP